MRIYTVHRRDRGLFKGTEIAFVKEGFSWPALAFTFLWAFWHSHWMLGLVLLAVDLGLTALAGWLDRPEGTSLPFTLAWHLVVAISADELNRWSLRLRGYVANGVVAGENLAMAEWRYFEAHPEIPRQ
ncbi:MAG: DUF2628 domain-containing protein [Alphaproteobacteria bacterium]|nr:DUF2628 domain-containing protein [Alphaproteobacteria bacterium]